MAKRKRVERVAESLLIADLSFSAERVPLPVRNSNIRVCMWRNFNILRGQQGWWGA